MIIIRGKGVHLKDLLSNLALEFPSSTYCPSKSSPLTKAPIIPSVLGAQRVPSTVSPLPRQNEHPRIY